MKFGKIDDYKSVNFEEIAIYKQDQTVLSSSNKKQTNIYLAATGWSNSSWKNVIYPAKTKAEHYLNYYSNQFKSIELNSTFYGIPTLEKVNKWIDQVSEDFRFCPKFPQSLSHRKDFGQSTGANIKWFETLSLFQNNLGTCFVQFPNYYDLPRLINQLDNLEKFSSVYPLAIELRNTEFYNHDHFQVLKKLCFERNIGLVLTDVAGRRDIYHHLFVHDLMMVRWAGNEDNMHNELRLRQWQKLIAQWTSIGHFDLYFMVHHPNISQVPKTCQYINQLFKDSMNIAIHDIDLLSTSQASLF